jgi:hypothetical protein
MAAFWVVAPCSMVEVYRVTRRPNDGGRKYLRNVGKRLSEYMALQPQDSHLLTTNFLCIITAYFRIVIELLSNDTHLN